MIRRHDDHDWLLIDQVEHARLAAGFAGAWGNNVFSPLPEADILVDAVMHHDDGWKAWAKAPEVDLKTGRPRNFTEMPMAIATEIWRRSIGTCGERHPLAGLWVSRHFCWLAQKAENSRSDDADECVAIRQFLADEALRQSALREHARAQYGDAGLYELIDIGFQYVQFFDALSLWLCCSARLEPYEDRVPSGGPVRFAPVQVADNTLHNAGNPYEITAEPYPFSVGRLELSVAARRIPARRYTGNIDLRTALQSARSETLVWLIRQSSEHG